MAKPKSKTQRSFFDADHFVSHLLDPKADGVYLTIKEVIASLIKDKDYAEMYSPLGRRPVSPRTLVLAMLLQFLENLPDRQAARNVRLRLDWKIAIGLELDDPGFHFSLLEIFRDRLEQNDKQRAAFTALLEKLKDLGLIQKNQKQRLDSTHVLGHLRRLSRLECMAESIRLALRALCRLMGEDAYIELVPAQIRDLYGSQLDIHKMDRQQVRRSLRASGKHALMLLERLEAHSRSSQLLLTEEVKTLRRVLEQYFDIAPDKEPVVKEKLPGGEGKDRIATPHEPQARWSQKRGKQWIGYKLQITETANRPTEEADGTKQPAVNFITDVEVTNAAEHDAQYTQRAIDRQLQQGFVPEELYTDEAYISGHHIAQANGKGVVLMGPVAAPNKRGVEIPQEAFPVDFEREQATCPQGKGSVYWKRDQQGSIQIRFPKSACGNCPLKTKCTNNNYGRTLTLVPNSECLQARREQMKTEDFKERMKARNGIEGTISELCRAHDARRSRYRGEKRLRTQGLFSALAVDVKRLARAIEEGLCPDLAFT